MRKQNYDSNQAAAHQLIVREQGGQYLPSTEVREIIPEFKDEIDLRDLLDTIIRRKNVVFAVLLLVFAAVAVYTFTITPQFRATGVLQVSAQDDKLTKFESVESTALKTMEFQQTQVKLLQSEQLATRVIERMDLVNNKDFTNSAKSGSGEAQATGLVDTIKTFIRPDESKDTLDLLSEDAKTQIIVDQSLNRFGRLLSVSPVRNSELIEIAFISPAPVLAAEVANTSMDEFINMHMDNKLKSSQDATKFLQKQIENAQITLEKSEMGLQQFARKIGIVSLDPKLNLIMRQLEELNEALAKARSHRISQEAKYEQVTSADAVSIYQMIENNLIQTLKNQYANLISEYQELSKTFKPAYPKMQQLKARMDELLERIRLEQQSIIDSIKIDYETALKTEQYLSEQAEAQKQLAMNLEEKATQYKILAREVATNKSIYQSLLERSKEIEATVGAAVTNIQIVDYARPPLYPFKPRVALNLALGLVLGLLVGVGTAFVFEYFDNTIKNPDEMAEKFGIPVLGLIPFDREDEEDRRTIALKFFNEPRSPMAEAFRTTMTSVRLSVADDPPKTILFTSILPGAGKSTMSSNACLSYLAEDERCLLIDVDLRKPSLHHVFKKGAKGKGLSSILSGMETFEEVVYQTEFTGLDFISSGPLPPQPCRAPLFQAHAGSATGPVQHV